MQVLVKKLGDANQAESQPIAQGVVNTRSSVLSRIWLLISCGVNYPQYQLQRLAAMRWDTIQKFLKVALGCQP